MSRRVLTHPETFAECTEFPQAVRLVLRQIEKERAFTLRERAAGGDPAYFTTDHLDDYERQARQALELYRREMQAARKRIVAQLQLGTIPSDYRAMFADAIESGDFTVLEI